jgi:colicin import membrane protein
VTQANVTYEAVAKVSNELISEGLKPSVRAVRERLGGSNTTLVRHLRTWHEARDAVQRQPRDLPGELVLAVRRAMSEVETNARAEAGLQMDIAHKTIDELLAESEALEQRLKVVASESAAAECAADEGRGRESELRRELERSSGEAAGLAAKLVAEQMARASLQAQLDAERSMRAMDAARLQEMQRALDGHATLATRLAAADATASELRGSVATLQALLTGGSKPSPGAKAPDGRSPRAQRPSNGRRK